MGRLSVGNGVGRLSTHAGEREWIMTIMTEEIWSVIAACSWPAGCNLGEVDWIGIHDKKIPTPCSLWSIDTTRLRLSGGQMDMHGMQASKQELGQWVRVHDDQTTCMKDELQMNERTNLSDLKRAWRDHA